MDELIHQTSVLLWNDTYTDWTRDLFSARWFYIIILTIIGYIVWIKILDKKRLKELLLVGSFATVSLTAIDIAGTNMQLWGYNIRILPFLAPPVLMNDYTLLPIAIMIVHQFSHTWTKYLVWSAVTTGLFAFILWPVHVWAGITTLYKWNSPLSFLTLYSVAIITRAAFNWVSAIEHKAKTETNKLYAPNLQPAFKPLKKDKVE